MRLPDPEAFRFNYDGYGWGYRDNGSGSSWMAMCETAPDKEFMYTHRQLRQAVHDAIDECAGICDEADKQGQSQWPQRFASMIRRLKENV